MNESGQPYSGSLTPEQAAAAIQAARLNGIELMDSSEILFNLKRFGHSVALSTLAIEEAAKAPILLATFLGLGDNKKLWKSYRLHRAKSAFLNLAIESRTRAVFPNIPDEKAKQIAQEGPSPETLDSNKQRSLYSDCLEVDGSFVCHLPRNIDWRNQAWERLCEAKAMCLGLRDYPPEELSLWRKHADLARAEDSTPKEMLEALHKDLVSGGFVKQGWWDVILKDIEDIEAA